VINPQSSPDGLEGAPAESPATGACLLDRAGHVLAADAAVRIWLFDGGLPQEPWPQPLAADDALASAIRVALERDNEQPIHGFLSTRNPPSALRFTVRRLDGELGPLALVEFQAIGATSEATTDALTGLPDRRALADRTAEWQREAAGGPAAMAVLFLDLDDFRLVNDQHGHAVGDRVLVELAKRWQRCVREEDLVARYGGDEFVLLLKNVATTHDAEPIVGRLLDATAESIDVGEAKLRVTATIGLVAGPADSQALDKIIDAADRDMYARKNRKTQ
jgi:diguanylate cyclase (GGDEF)-like protein